MTTLQDLIALEAEQSVSDAARSFADALYEHYGPAVQAILFYGSCLQSGSEDGLMLDFYVLGEDLPALLEGQMTAFACRALPPNVYYHEHKFDGRTLRAKVAVMRTQAFADALIRPAFIPSLWARFSQPAAVVLVKDAGIKAQLGSAMAGACRAMLTSVLPVMAPSFSASQWWQAALAATYGAELRPEKDSKPAALVAASVSRFEAVALTVAAELKLEAHGQEIHHTPIPATAAKARRRWAARRVGGKVLNALRLIKALFTFRGGIDYAVWKMQRHSGVAVPVTDFDRRFPLIGAIRIAWRAKRSGAVK